MPTIINYKEISSIVKNINILPVIKEAFIQYSNGNSVVPPVGELLFEDPPGDVHIKYGYIKSQEFYVIKIASGFYKNTDLGIPSGQGLMLLFKQQTGELEAILLDEGYLTNIRTVAAGALAVQHFAPQKIRAAGVIGTGTIAKLQIQQLQQNKLCKKFWLWGRNEAKVHQLKAELGSDFEIHIAATCAEVAQNANVIITTTPSEIPLLQADDIKPGTLLVAIGSDTQHKQELASEILQKADLVIADSISQSKSRGEVYQAVKAKLLPTEKVMELGSTLQDSNLHGTPEEQITVVDLTGVAVQDIMIASAVFANYQK